MTLSKRLSAKTGRVKSGKCPLAKATTAAIDLHLRQALHRLVLEHLFGDAAVAAADDEHLFGVAVREQRHVAHHLLIDIFVTIGDLGRAVQHHHLAEELVLEQHQVLLPGLAFR